MVTFPPASDSPSVSAGGLRSWLRRHPLMGYFGLAYGLTWLVSLPYLLSVWGFGADVSIAGFMLKQWIGPALAGLIMAGVLGGRAGWRELRSQGRKWRIGWRWYLALLAGPPLLILVGMLIVMGAPVPPVVGSGIAGTYLVSFALVFIAVGFPEELGWRGFALPLMQARFGPLAGSLILGLLWAGWHLPFFLTPDHGGGPGADWTAVAANFGLFAVMVVILSIPFSFVFNRTGGSVFAAAMLHASSTLSNLSWSHSSWEWEPTPRPIWSGS